MSRDHLFLLNSKTQKKFGIFLWQEEGPFFLFSADFLCFYGIPFKHDTREEERRGGVARANTRAKRRSRKRDRKKERRRRKASIRPFYAGEIAFASHHRG